MRFVLLSGRQETGLTKLWLSEDNGYETGFGITVTLFVGNLSLSQDLLLSVCTIIRSTLLNKSLYIHKILLFKDAKGGQVLSHIIKEDFIPMVANVVATFTLARNDRTTSGF